MARPAGDARSRILSAAGKLLRKSGAADLTQELVAREAQCAKGLVTYHFKGRDALLAAAAADLCRARQEHWTNALEAPTLEQAITRVWDLVAREATDGFWRAWISLYSEGSELTVQTVNNHWSDFISNTSGSTVALLESMGLEPTVEPPEVGRLLAAGLQGLGLQMALGQKPAELEGTHAALWAAVLSLTRPAR